MLIHWDNWCLKKPYKNPFGRKREFVFIPAMG